MPSETTIECTASPALWPLYRRILFRKRPGLKAGESLPGLAAHWPDAAADAETLTAYREACAFEDDGHLPLLYPHVLTGGLHMSIIAHDSFPLSPLGSVHLRDHILQHRPIPAEAAMDCLCRISGQRVAKSGLEFDVTTVVTVEGSRLWESISTYLVRGKKYGEPQEAPALAAMADLEQPDTETQWHVPRNMGRRYAGISKDYNPIHISRILAKLFGFKRDLIHGFWSAARCLNAVPALPADDSVRCDLLFKGPVFMDSDVRLKAAVSETRRRFDLFCGSNPRPCLAGAVWSEATPSPLVT